MTKSKATATIVMWISIATMFSVSVVACGQYNTTVRVAEIQKDAAQWNGLHDDCQKRNGLLIRSWGDWKCEVSQ